MRTTRRRAAQPKRSGESSARAALADALLASLHAGGLAQPAEFADLFEQVAAFQRRFGTGVRGLRGLPGSPADGMVPVDLFKYRRLASHPPRAAAGYFLSSGTSRGAERRARHEFASFALYEAALARGFAQAVFGQADLDRAWLPSAPRWNLLVPAGAAWWHGAHSSLAHMGRTLWRSLAAHADAELHCIDPAAPRGQLRQAIRRLTRRPDRLTLGFGTGFGFLHLIDRLMEIHCIAPLHPQSRVMETGGYKGRGRELAPAQLHAAMAACFQLAPGQVLAEYGMTELSSQAYQVFDTPRGAVPFPDLPVYWPAESLRVRAVDAAGEPCSPGVTGLLEVRDPMNLTSACHLLLGDVGVVLAEPAGPRRGKHAATAAGAEFTRVRFQVLGRAQRLAARGCGLADDLAWLPRAAAATARP